MRLLILTSSFPRNKNDISGRFIREMTETLALAGFEIEVLAPASENADSCSEEPVKLFKVKRFKYFWPPKMQLLAYGDGIPENIKRQPLLLLLCPFFFMSFFINAIKLSMRSDVIHSHWIIPSGLIGALVKSLLGKRMILTVHSADLHSVHNMRISYGIVRFILSKCDRIFVLTHEQKEMLESIAGKEMNISEKTEISPMGFKEYPFYKKEALVKYKREIAGDGEKIVLYTGRLVPVKGIRFLIEAVTAVKGCRTVIVGDGSERGSLKAFAEQKEANVIFKGVLTGEEKIKMLDIADIVVFPSIVLKNKRTEGVPVSLIEAMSRGKAIIASDVGGISMLIRNNENGILVSHSDHKVLQREIVRLINDDEMIKTLGEKARLSSIGFNLEKIGEKYSNAYFGRIKEDFNGIETCNASLE